MATDTGILDELRSLGKEQNRKVFPRHGVTGDLYGVSYADLDRLAKRLKGDHALALQLWASGNHDARVLATMIADPARADAALLDGWVSDAENYVLAEAVAGFASKTSLARAKMEEWLGSPRLWTAYAGWNMLARLALDDKELPNDYFAAYLPLVERDVHRDRNRLSHAMNGALIAIGTRNENLKQAALAAAGRIGKVHVDHGDTYCKTPEAVPYIEKAWLRRR
ncbi:MAG: DNA alkylation repair protein [Chloroflexota bacterium]